MEESEIDLLLDVSMYTGTFENIYPTGCYKTLIYPISALENEFNPRNTTGMPVVKLIFRLELEEIFIP